MPARKKPSAEVSSAPPAADHPIPSPLELAQLAAQILPTVVHFHKDSSLHDVENLAMCSATRLYGLGKTHHRFLSRDAAGERPFMAGGHPDALAHFQKEMEEIEAFRKFMDESAVELLFFQQDAEFRELKEFFDSKRVPAIRKKAMENSLPVRKKLLEFSFAKLAKGRDHLPFVESLKAIAPKRVKAKTMLTYYKLYLECVRRPSADANDGLSEKNLFPAKVNKTEFADLICEFEQSFRASQEAYEAKAGRSNSSKGGRTTQLRRKDTEAKDVTVKRVNSREDSRIKKAAAQVAGKDVKKKAGS